MAKKKQRTCGCIDAKPFKHKILIVPTTDMTLDLPLPEGTVLDKEYIEQKLEDPNTKNRWYVYPEGKRN